MSFARKLKRQEQLQEARNSYCTRCGEKLVINKGKIKCKKCNAYYGKVSDRV